MNGAEPESQDAEGRRLLQRANILLPGLYAWSTTVLYPVTLRGAGWPARVAAGLALLALLVSPALVSGRPRLARLSGVVGFIGFSLLTWLLLGSLLSQLNLDGLRGGTGAVGWAVYAVGWGATRRVGSVPEENPEVIEGPPLPARANLGPIPHTLFGVALLGALVPLFLAWRVERSEHALLAHAAALTAAIAMVSVGARVAVERARWQPVGSAGQRINAATRPLVLLIVALGAGFVFSLLR